MLRIMLILVTLSIFGCGTKKNPGVCCLDEADCAAAGLPNDSTCQDGLLCRGHQCVELGCETSDQCDLSAPHCDGATCQEACTADDECPGFGQSAADRFCEAGACVSCRDAMTDCASSTPICDQGACRRCERHNECGSGVCDTDGTCVRDTSIAHVAADGAAASDCTRLAPCTLARALAVTPLRKYLLFANGSYSQAGTVTVTGLRHLIGSGGRPVVTNTLTGPVFKLGFMSEVTFENLEVSGARTGTSDSGNGIECNMGTLSTIHLVDVVLAQNAAAGLKVHQCTFDATRSEFRNNAQGVSAVDGNGSFDRCTISANTGYGLYLDAGLYAVRNSFIVRNGGIGIEIYPSTPGNVVELNTIADNMTGFSCISDGTSSGAFANNIVVRNATNTDSNASCTYPGSIILGDLTSLKFKSPDVAPFDYHLTAGSVAIDQATAASTALHDYDGEARPSGAARDVGADELH